MSEGLKWNIKGQTLSLRGDKTILWENKNILLLSDLHIGKVMHFRRSGFAVPVDTARDNLERLSFSLLNSDIDQVIFLGDLYHSSENLETELFWQMINKFPELTFILVKGNHDVHSDKHFEKKGIKVYEELRIGPFSFTHEPKETPETLYNIAGHIHPAIQLRGKARTFLRLPCFYFNEWQGILPAFGAFTGMYTLSPKRGDRVFAVADHERVVDVSII